MRILWVRHLSRGIWNFSKSLLDFLCRSLPNGATSEGVLLEFEIQSLVFLEEGEIAMWRHLRVAPRCHVSEGRSRGSRRCHLRGVWILLFLMKGETDMWRHLRASTMTCVRRKGTGFTWCHLKESLKFKFLLFLEERRDWHVAPSQGGSYNDMWQEGKARNMWRPHRQSRKR